MALMIDNKPEYQGEALVWTSLKENLPDNIIVYHNREIKGKEFDFCLLIEGGGALIIEVKGWSRDKITVHGSDAIEVEGYLETQRSPKKQARMYRYSLLNVIKDRFDLSPLVMDMVCYPFLSKEDFYRLRLDVVCEETFVLFNEDLRNPEDLFNKIQGVFESNKYAPHDDFSYELYSKIRQMWEPDYLVDPEEPTATIYPYSYLYIIPNKRGNAFISKLVEQYFAGSKIVAYFGNQNDFNEAVNALDAGFEKKNLEPSFNNLSLGYKRGFKSNGETAHTFNCEFYYLNEVKDLSETDILLVEGSMSTEERYVVEKLANVTSFNYQQFLVEHASVNDNILVQAGAGTGKTFSMVSRVAYLCNKIEDPITNLDEEIALVTFTNDAANNMKVRLKQMFKNYYLLTSNPKYIHNIENIESAHVTTIHKLSFDILRQFSIYTGVGSNFTISSDEFTRGQLYDEYLSLFLLEKQEKNSTFINELSVPVYELKKKAMGIADKLLSKSIKLETISVSGMGDTVEGVVPYFNEIIEKVVIPSEIAYCLDRHEQNVLDLNECISLLETVLDQVGDRFDFLKYRFMFVDEFQDTDDVQIRVFQKLQKAISEKCKLFVVGDLKQSIYRFRGAQLSAFDQLKEAGEGGWQNFHLTTNYRTDHRLLDQLSLVFEDMGRQGFLPYKTEDDQLDSMLIKDLDEEDILTVINHQGDFENELIGEIEHQKELLLSAMETNTLSEAERTIAILVRKNWQVEEISKLAKNHNLEIIASSGDDLFQLDSTKDLYRLVQALANGEDTVSLVDFLNSNYVGLKLDFQQLHGLSKDETFKQIEAALDSFFTARMELSWQDVLQMANTQPILSVLRTIYDALAPWKQYSYSREAQEYYRMNYDYLLEQIISFAKIDGLTLNQVLMYLKINILTGQKKTAREIPHSDDIRLICTTIHKSKGLEYGTVILPYTNEDISDIKRVKLDASFSDSKLAYLVRFENGMKEKNTNYSEALEIDEQIAEESRILYVALTRAIRNCVWFNDLKSNASISWATMLEA